jgi:hypothetical protein
MRRRALFSLLGTVGAGSLAGCSTGFSMQPTPEVASTHIEARDRRCSDSPQESATITSHSNNGTLIEITGSIVVPRIRDELYVGAQNSVGKQGRDDAVMEVHIDFGPFDPHVNTDVPECEGRITYNAEVKFTHPPKEVIVRHVVEDRDSYTLKTMTTQTISQ